MDEINCLNIIKPNINKSDPTTRYVFTQFVPSKDMLDHNILRNKIIIVHIPNGYKNRLVRLWFRNLEIKYHKYVSLCFHDMSFETFKDYFLNELREDIIFECNKK